MNSAHHSICTVPGFQASGVRAGIKSSNRRDLALLLSDRRASAAAVYTANRVYGPPLDVCRSHLRDGMARAIVVNSGIANACTGTRGSRDAVEMCRATGLALKIEPSDVLVASTGVIGDYLPMGKIRAGIRRAARALGRTAAHSDAAAKAIMTTDQVPKQSYLHCRCGQRAIHLGAIAKGSGMIAPNMATMLAFIVTDAAIHPASLRSALKAAVNATFNLITVDGHTSTSDMVAILANGASGTKRITRGSSSYAAFKDALTFLCSDLADQIVADGEGATRLVRIRVTGAASSAEARRAAMAIANSTLVKCAFHGADPNWGRIVSAAGCSGARCREEQMTCRIAGTTVFRNGIPARVNARQLNQRLKAKRLLVELDLAAGDACATALTCDLSQEYVRINADYHT